MAPIAPRVHAGPRADAPAVAYLAMGATARVGAVSGGRARLVSGGHPLGWVDGAFLTPA